MMSSSEYLFLESEWSFTKYVSSCPNAKYLYNNWVIKQLFQGYLGNSQTIAPR